MTDGFDDLCDSLKSAVSKRGIVAFGVAPVEDLDSMPRLKIGSPFDRWSEPFRKHMPEARRAIVFAIQSLDDADEIAIQRNDGSWSFPGYLPISLAGREIVSMLRKRGFKAAFAPELSSHKRAAVMAGIGGYGKQTLVIHPRYGPWLRFGVVVTDAPLPLDRPFTRDLCGKCQRCIAACPAKAIKPYEVDPMKCLVSSSENFPVPEAMRRLLPKYELQLTPNSHIMCTECQMACRYTSAERRRNAVLRPFKPAVRRIKRR